MVAVLVFGVLIFVHEAGHFTAAKLSGVKVNEFALGMGPAFAKIKRGETQYSLRVFPIGGFVSMEGEDASSADARAFTRAKLWKRVIIICAGAFMNVLLGFILAVVFVVASPVHTTVVSGFVDASTSSKSGLQTGDRIVAINGSRVHISTDIMYDLVVVNKKTVEVEVERAGKFVKLPAVAFPLVDDGNGGKAMTEDFTLQPEHKTVFSVMRQSYYWTLATVRIVWVTLAGLFNGRYGVKDLSGPVGVSAAMGQAASAGWLPLLFITILITVNLGVVNLLPLPALDGGRLLFMIIEAVRRKPIKPEIEGGIHFAGFVLLILLVIFITFSDVSKLTGGLFG